ncbi:MAG: hypothetical protein J5545_02130 [Bacteroidaceae bacterium]|nr:hypothetical protein [Bacteroidaceae bacterium]
MEKKVVYSLIAFSALSTGMAQAKDVPAGQQVKTSSAEEWESVGAYTLESNVLTVSSNREITQAIGKLQKGTYKLLVELGTQPTYAADGKMYIKVEIGGASEKFYLTSETNNQVQTVEFTLDSEQDVTLSLKSNYSAKPFTAQGFSITVDFPDEEVAAELYKAQQLLTFIDGAGYATKAADLETATDYVEKLTLMNGNQTYDGYVTYKLYDESTLSGLDSDIEALKKIAENNQAAYETAQAITEAQAAITALDTRLAAIDDANGKKAAATAAKTAADEALAGFKAEADAAAEAEQAAEFDPEDAKLKAVQAAIDEYDDAVEAAEALAQQLAAQLAAAGYNDKLAAINAQKAIELTEPATNATYVAVQNAIAAAEAELEAFKHQFDAAYTAGDFTEFEPDPEAVNAAIAALEAAVQASIDNKAAYDARIAQLPDPKAAIADATAELAKYGSEKENTSDPYKAASDALGAVNLRLSQYTAAIEEAYAAGTAAAITDDEINGINADIEAVNALIAAAKANYDAYVATTADIAAAKADNTNAGTQIAELLKDAKYATLLAAAQAELAEVSAQIEAAEAACAANLAAGTAVGAEYEGLGEASTAIYNNYNEGKKPAFDAKLAEIETAKAEFAELVKDQKGIDAPKADAEAAIDAWAAAVNENAANMAAEAIADAEVAKNAAIADVNKMIELLEPIQDAEAGLDAAFAERKIEGVYDATTIYAAEIAAIKAKIANLTAAINEAYGAAAPGEFAYDTEGALNEIEEDIKYYNNESKGAFEMFQVDYAVYTANLEAYNEVYDLVKDLEIYTDPEVEINGRNYTTLLNNAKATIDQQKAEAEAAAATIGEGHFDAVVLLDFDNLVPGLNVLKENYEQDQAEYERQFAYRSYQKIVDRVNEKAGKTEASVDELKDEITVEKLGPAYPDILEKYEGLVQEFEAVQDRIEDHGSFYDTDNLTEEEYNQWSAAILNDQADLEAVSQKFTALKDNEIKAAKENVAANATAVAALAPVLDKLEDVQALLEGDCADVADFFNEDVAKAQTTYNNLVAAVDAAYDAGTLKKAWYGPAEGEDAKTLEAQTSELAEKLAGIESDAKVKEAAYKANEAAYADAEDALDEVKAALAQAVTDNTTAAKSYYEKVLLGYAGELAELEAKIEASYAAWTSAADLEGQKAALNTLKGKINQVKPDALANEEAYNKQTLALAELKKLAEAVKKDIEQKNASLDENADPYIDPETLDALADELAGYQEEIDEIDLLNLFINGKSALPLESGKTQSEEIDEYKVKVLAVQDAINGTYNAAVAAENISKKAAFDKEFGFATDAYTAAYNLWLDSSENLSDEGLKDDIADQTEVFHDALYDIAEDMKATKDAAEDEYANLNPGEYFDYPSNYIQAAIDYKNTIENVIKKNFYDSVKDIVNNVWNATANEVTAAILAAQADFANNNIPFADDTFQDIEDLLAQGAEYAAATDIKNVDATIDALMKKTSGMKWYEKQIADAKDAAAKAKCAGDIAAKQLPEDYAELFDSEFDDINETYAAAYKKTADDLLAAATAANKDFSTMGDVAEILAEIEPALADVIAEYNAALGERYSEIEQAELDAEAFEAINDAIAATQKKLDDAVADLAKLQNVDTDFDAEELQARIDEQKQKVTSETGAALKQESIENALKAIENDIDDYLTIAAATVKIDLLAYIEDMKPAVNEAIAADFETGSAIQARLEELKELIPAAATIAKLAEYQQEVYEIGETLDYDPYAAERAELLAVLETLASKKLPSDDPRLTDQFAEPLAEQLAIVEAMTEAIQNDPSLSGADYDEDVAEVEAEINQIIKDAKAFKTKMDQSDKKYKSLTKQLNGEAEIFEKVKADIEAYEYVDITKAPYKGMVTAIQAELDAIAEVLEQNKEAVELYTANRDVVNQRNADIEEVTGMIQNLAETAADQEVNAIADNFLDQLADVYYNPSRYSGAVQDDITAQKQLINDMILEIDALAEEVTTGSIETMADVKALEAEITEAFEMLYKQLAEGTLGDVNHDGKVNVVDYQVIINHVLNGDDYVASYDLNNSGSVTVSDATAIADLIIEGKNPETGGNFPIHYVRGKQASDEALTLQAVSATRFAVNLKNAREYTAFQMDIQLPEGLKVTAVSLGERAENHEVASRELANGKLRVIGSSIMNEAFAGSDGAVLYIDVELAENAKGAQLTLENVLFSDKASHDVAFRVKGQATGIKGFGIAVKERIYDLGGRMMNGIRKGISIVRGDNGSSKKVIK